jgi:2-polyprenyl-6-methoxyphenol hydroxylase-like FAD-dependent oxidoreductase
MVLHGADGTLLHTQKMVLENNGHPFCNTHRGYMQKVIYEYASKIGIVVKFGVRVTEYFENEKEAGVIADGQRYAGDVVVGCDGIHSKARHVVTGAVDKPVSSGYAVFRAWFPIERLNDDPVLAALKDGGDSMNAWIGPDVHVFVTICTRMDCLGFLVTHKDEYSVEESWSFPGKIEDLCRVLDNWDPVLQHLARMVPSDKLIDWKLLWRNPVRKWVSNNGRFAISGDAAHPFLPSSGNGASQAIEDGATIATALRLAGKENVPLALRAYEALR